MAVGGVTVAIGDRGVLRSRVVGVCCAAAVLFVSAATAPAGSARPFPHPDRIRYDEQCLMVDGKDMVIYSGAFHYFRCPKELWRDRFQKIKEAGFNTVETYIAWNAQERQVPTGLDDYSKVDLRDVDDWLTMAEEFGLYVIIRPGPFICAEWDRGGLPSWLMTKRPADYKQRLWLRTDDPTFVAWSKHWYHAVCPMLARHQITRRKPGEAGIILFQLENEYDASKLPADVMTNYVKALAEAATAEGIDVPFMTCWTKVVRGSSDPVLRGVFDSCNFYPGWNVNSTLRDVDKLRHEQPDAPLMTTELQGGWLTLAMGDPPIRPDVDHYRDDLVPAQINNLTLLMWEKGETITNYYMLFGGTNLADTGGFNIATSYDYSAPIRECGGVGEKYLRVKALGAMIREHGARLARAKAVDCETTTDQPDVTVAERRARDGSRYLFVRTSQHAQPRGGTARVKPKDGNGLEVTFHYELEPLGSKVLYLPPGVADAARGQWLPPEQPAPQRPAAAELPAPVKIAEVAFRADPGPATWKPMRPGEPLDDLGVYDSRFVYYKGKLTLSDNEIRAAGGNPILDAACFKADGVSLVLNGQRVAPIQGRGHQFGTGQALHAGENDVALLYENAGYPNLGPGTEKRAGVTRVRFLASDPEGVRNDGGAGGLGRASLPFADRGDAAPSAALMWSDEPAGIAGKWWETDFDATGWTKRALPEDPRETGDANALLTWHRLRFALPEAKSNVWVPWLARLHATGNGFVYLHGHCIGRYWEGSKQRDFYLPECWLSFGAAKQNVITLCLRPLEKGAAVASAEVMPYTVYAERRSEPRQ